MFGVRGQNVFGHGGDSVGDGVGGAGVGVGAGVGCNVARNVGKQCPIRHKP